MVKDEEYKKIKEELKGAEVLIVEIEAKLKSLNGDFTNVVEILMGIQ